MGGRGGGTGRSGCRVGAGPRGAGRPRRSAHAPSWRIAGPASAVDTAAAAMSCAAGRLRCACRGYPSYRPSLPELNATRTDVAEPSSRSRLPGSSIAPSSRSGASESACTTSARSLECAGTSSSGIVPSNHGTELVNYVESPADVPARDPSLAASRDVQEATRARIAVNSVRRRGRIGRNLVALGDLVNDGSGRIPSLSTPDKTCITDMPHQS